MNHIERDDQARAILQGNDRGGYTVPTAGLYPYQWNWDSAFSAWGFATFDTDRAWSEIETLLSGQWDSGMVPHIVFNPKVGDSYPFDGLCAAAHPVPQTRSWVLSWPGYLGRKWRADPVFRHQPTSRCRHHASRDL